MAIGFVSGFSVVPRKPVAVSSRRGKTVAMANDLDRDRKVTSTSPDESTKATEFIDNVQTRFERYTEQIQNVDFSDLQNNASKSSKRLATNFLAGEWLQRGETFGVLQIITALFILRGQGGFDPLFALIFGPGVLLAGAFVCVKSKSVHKTCTFPSCHCSARISIFPPANHCFLSPQRFTVHSSYVRSLSLASDLC
mmetsp:Transcript_10752/g.32906  ORF Transcript_10752/g.32906 Transcript_10752/m.32906 type:complete len:196 (+) Transcript_10752:146-733(+)